MLCRYRKSHRVAAKLGLTQLGPHMVPTATLTIRDWRFSIPLAFLLGFRITGLGHRENMVHYGNFRKDTCK
jgi:hypothetical protein